MHELLPRARSLTRSPLGGSLPLGPAGARIGQVNADPARRLCRPDLARWASWRWRASIGPPGRIGCKPGESILGLRLRPGVAGTVLGMPASEVVDHPHIPLEDLLGPGAAELEERLGETVGEERGLRPARAAGRVPASGGGARSARPRGHPAPRLRWEQGRSARRDARHQRPPAAATLSRRGRVRAEDARPRAALPPLRVSGVLGHGWESSTWLGWQRTSATPTNRT